MLQSRRSYLSWILGFPENKLCVNMYNIKEIRTCCFYTCIYVLMSSLSTHVYQLASITLTHVLLLHYM